MTRSYALMRLLELGPLTRKEIRDITGWPEEKLKRVINGLERQKKVRNVDGIWHRRYEDRSLQSETV